MVLMEQATAAPPWAWRADEAKRVASALLLGQLVSMSLAVTSFTSSLIASRGVDTPLTQCFFTYFLVSAFYGTQFLYRRQNLMIPWYWYALLGFVDLQGNYLVTKAYQFSSITSVTLLDCWTIPWVIILTWLVLGTKYSPSQFVGAVVCVLGLALVLVSDSSSSSSSGSKPLLGDSLVIVGTFSYAFSNVAEEFCVKKKSVLEFLAMLGVFGMLFCAVQISVFERKELQCVQWSPTMVALFAAFAMASFTFYALTPYVLKISGSALFNLSLLTSDMWAVLIRIYVYGQRVDWLYFVAFAVVAAGLVVYSLGEMKAPTQDGTDVAVIASEDDILGGHYLPLVQDAPPPLMQDRPSRRS